MQLIPLSLPLLPPPSPQLQKSLLGCAWFCRVSAWLPQARKLEESEAPKGKLVVLPSDRILFSQDRISARFKDRRTESGPEYDHRDLQNREIWYLAEADKPCAKAQAKYSIPIDTRWSSLLTIFVESSTAGVANHPLAVAGQATLPSPP